MVVTNKLGVLLEKLIVSQPVEKLTAFYGD
jgi:hypothetical protein